MADGYNDELTAEEQALLQQHETDTTMPAPEGDEGAPVAPAAPAAPATAAPEAAPAAAPSAEPQPGQSEDERFAAWMAQHQGKTPEELARMAFQQSNRANAAGFQARQSRESLEAIQTRVRDAATRAQQRREGLATRRQEFDAQLRDDPDAATRAIAERLMAGEEQEIAREEHAARATAAEGFAAAHIPDFNRPALNDFGTEMGYSPDELANVTDGRDLITLHLASMAGRLIKAGMMDVRGNLRAMPEPVAATDPRLQTPAPVKTLSTAPARPSGGGRTVEDQLGDISRMSDADFDKLDPAVLENLLRQAG